MCDGGRDGRFDVHIEVVVCAVAGMALMAIFVMRSGRFG